MNFTPQRITKKYCSNTCKQMDYFKRNGLLGINNSIKEEREPITIKKIPLFPHNITEHEEEFPFTVKQQVVDEEKTTLSVKYDNPNEEVTVKEDDLDKNKTELTVKQQVSDNEKEALSVKYDTPNNKESNFTVKKNADLEKDKIAFYVKGNQKNEYQYVNPKFFDWISQHLDKAWHYKLVNPTEHWAMGSVVKVKWVSPRIRCLFESLLKLSNYMSINRSALFALTDAFIRLTEAPEFKGLPIDYLYIIPVKDLRDKLLHLLAETKGQEMIRFRLSAKMKAIIMAMRYEMASYVPAMKFSQLTFGDQQMAAKDQDKEDN
jgi:hypothetical protein